jgi:hypothetical protein
MKKIFTSAFLLLVITIITQAQTTGSFQKSISFTEPDYTYTRTLYYFVPTDYNPANSYKLVIGFRGGPHTNAGQFRDQLSFFADSINAIVVCPENSAHFNNQEGLVKQLFKYSLDTIRAEYNIDTNFIYLTGLSYGGRHAVIVAMDTDNGPIPNLRGVIPFATGSNGHLEPNYSAIAEFSPACICIGLNDNANFKNVAATLHSDIQANNGISMLNEIPGVGHTVAFPTYPTEMMKCINFIESNNTPNAVLEIGAKQAFNLKVFPNPTANYVQLEIPVKVKPSDIFITDVSGKLLLKVDANERRIDVSQLTIGVKLIVVVSDQGSVTKPIVIER